MGPVSPWDRNLSKPPRPRWSQASSTPDFRASARNPNASNKALLPTPFLPMTAVIADRGFFLCGSTVAQRHILEHFEISYSETFYLCHVTVLMRDMAKTSGRGRSAFPTFTRVVYHVGCLQHRFALRQPDDKYVIDASLYFNTSSLLGQGVYFISLCRFDLGIEDSTREIVSLR